MSKFGPLKRGDRRPDGKRFWCYLNGREYWVSEQKYESTCLDHRRRDSTPSRRAHKANYRRNVPNEHNLVSDARRRSKLKGLPFNLLDSDVNIPKFCPALGIPLLRTGKLSDNSPTLDRLRPELGYVRGNVNVLSLKANAIKRNADAAELRAIADWMDKKLK